MEDDILKWSVPVALGVLSASTMVGSLFYNVGGLWERVREPDEEPKGPPERLSLGQFGPVVRGRRDIPGGWQEYSGTMWGRSVTLIRRDFGVDALKRSFPEPLAKQLHGDVFAELRLTLTEENTVLTGTFTPQKIDFLLAPPRITQRTWLKPVLRTYRRMSAVELQSERPVGMAG